MMYWIPKLRHISPWPAPETRIDDSQEACKLAIKQIGSADLENEVTVFHVSIVRYDFTQLLSQITCIIFSFKCFRQKMMNCQLKIRGL